MQRILDTIINPVLNSESLPDAVRQRLRVRLARAIAANHRQINDALQTELGQIATELDEVRGKAERLLYPVPLGRGDDSP